MASQSLLRLEAWPRRHATPYVIFDDTFTSQTALSCEPTVSPLNDNEIEFRISFDESDDEDYTVIFDKNSFFYQIIYVDNMETDSKNDNDKVNMPMFPSPELTVSYFDDLDYLKDFENEFPAIVYNDALTSKSDFLIEPTVNPQHIDEFNETSLSECYEEEQNILYFIDLFPFNIIYPDGLKSDKENDDMALPPRDQRHEYISFEVLEYTDADITNFEERLGIGLYTAEEIESIGFDAYWAESARQIPDKGDLSAYWVGISSAGDFLRTTTSYTSIRDLMLRLCHRLIACSLAGRSQAPEKGRLQGLTVIVQDLPVIDMAELVAAAGALEVTEGAPLVDEGSLAVPAPVQVPQPPPVARSARTIAQRLGRLEEDVYGLRGALGEQSKVLDSMAYDSSRFTTWTITRLLRMMDQAGVMYTSYADF
ncbi:hypothetical protein Tco_0684942 [Tanacetum coccineum]